MSDSPRPLEKHELLLHMDFTRPIVLTTDFGDIDGYVGVMKGVILSISPRAVIIDLSHAIQPQNLLQASFVLGSSAQYFPSGSIHVVVIDPGVGTNRDLLILETPGATFIAPDNGVLSSILLKNMSSQPIETGYIPVPNVCDAYVLTESEIWLNPVSNTFHGRDILAPVAAQIALGMPASQLGSKVDRIFFLAPPVPICRGDVNVGEVINRDRFGNLTTNITEDLFLNARKVVVDIKGKKIIQLSKNFAEGSSSGSSVELLALIGSHGLLEIAVKNGNAAEILSADVGEQVLVWIDAKGELYMP